MNPMVKTILFAAIALVLGLILGFVLGRTTLERQWSQPYTQVAPGSQPNKSEGGNPMPKVGTKILKPMPIARSRLALKSFTEKDPVVSNVAAVGAGDEGLELHVVVENRSACTVTSLGGVAYGFDAWGKPSRLNTGGETFVAFESKAPIEAGKKATVALALKDVEDATLAIAHVDRTTCSDGTSWARQ
ncbi:MAG: hypothetical protein JWO86_7455 [Myxococcaceae bacterium]|nr:hypothetical protein [Myxococcaceae bacterium]MEA2753466.1 hypothetical protein [Myxococcales bacterium]